MKTKLSSLLMAAVLGLSVTTISTNALADVGKMVGPVTKITLAADGKSATAVLKDGKSGELVTITVNDDLTLDKFKDKRISAGDEIRASFEKDGKNTSKSFKKTAGC
jgi:flagellar hook assembly protein FlgD